MSNEHKTQTGVYLETASQIFTIRHCHPEIRLLDNVVTVNEDSTALLTPVNSLIRQATPNIKWPYLHDEGPAFLARE